MADRVPEPEAGRIYPADLQSALERVGDTARPFADSEVEALRAALSIALLHVAQPEPERPELVIQWAEEDIVYGATDWRGEPTEVIIPAGSFYPVCPACCRHMRPTVVEDGTNYRRTHWRDVEEIADPGTIALLYEISDSDDWECDDSALLCSFVNCSTRLSEPEWIEATYT